MSDCQRSFIGLWVFKTLTVSSSILSRHPSRTWINAFHPTRFFIFSISQNSRIRKTFLISGPVKTHILAFLYVEEDIKTVLLSIHLKNLFHKSTQLDALRTLMSVRSIQLLKKKNSLLFPITNLLGSKHFLFLWFFCNNCLFHKSM